MTWLEEEDKRLDEELKRIEEETNRRFNYEYEQNDGGYTDCDD